MPNIVVAIYNPLIRQKGMYPYFETFLNGLRDAGNNVLCFEKVAVEITLNEEIPEKYLEQIKRFNPDLFILFNNQFWDISKHFDQPIIIYDVDSPNVYCNINKLKKNRRYKYLTIQQAGIEIIRSTLEDDEIEVKYIPPFTGVQAENIEQTINIGFCGSHWLWNDFTMIEDFLQKQPTQIEREYAKKVYKMFYVNPFEPLEKIYKTFDIELNKKIVNYNSFLLSTRMSGIKRLRYLLNIEDLGLEIRGYFWNCPNSTPLKAFPELLLSYTNEAIINTKTTQDFYNSAKIGFNVNHIQAKSGFSWRVCDILASKACLVTEKVDDLKFFGVNIIQYESPAEARELCQKLLLNENYRQDVVNQCNEIIDKKHRFVHILPLLEDFVGFKLNTTNEGSLIIINTNINTNSQNEKDLSLKNKIQYKIWKHFDKKLKNKNII